MTTKGISRIISIIFHPLMMATFGVLIIYNSGTIMDLDPLRVKLKIYFTVFTMTFLLPAIVNAVLNNFNLISNYELSEHRDRVIPLFVTLICYFALFYMIRNLAIPFMVKKFIFASTITVAVIFIVSVFWKISAHMAGVSGLTSLVLAFMIRLNTNQIYFFCLLILLSGLIAFSRLKLNAHTPAQIYSGFIAGFLIVYFTLIYI